MERKMRVIYMGTPEYARVILGAIIESGDFDVPLVLTQPDRPVGRKQTLTPPPVKVLASEHGIEVLQPQRLSEEGILERIVALEPDFIVVAAFGQILPKTILDIAPCINLHASLLPQYRGASPIQQSLLGGDTQTGVTSMLMDVGLDTGAILQMITFDIPPTMRLSALMEQLTHDAARLTLETLRNFDQTTPTPQEDANATLCKKIKRGDGEVDMEDARVIYNKYRAFEGWPMIFTSGGIKLEDVNLVDDHTPHRGYEILGFEGESILIGCTKGVLKIGTLQPPSKRAMSAKGYCVGRGLKIGDLLI